MDVAQISERRYAKLAGTLYGVRIRQDRKGSTWMLLDGSVVTEMVVPDGWVYYLVRA